MRINIGQDKTGGLVNGLVDGLVDGLTAVDKNIDTLKKNNIIRRVGSSRSGHWEIIKK